MVFALQEAQIRYHNAGLPYRLSIISLSFPHSCATGGFRLANDTCMCRYTLPRRRHWLFGGAGHRGTQKQGPSTGGEGEGGAGEDVRGCGGDVGRVFGYLYREKRGIKGGKGWEEKGTVGGGMCTGRERFLWGIGGRSNLSRSQHTLFKHGHHLRFRSASLDSATSSELSLSVSIPSISSSCCSFVSLPSYHLLSHTHPYSSLPLLHLSLYIVFSTPLSHKISPSTSHTSFAFSIPPPPSSSHPSPTRKHSLLDLNTLLSKSISVSNKSTS